VSAANGTGVPAFVGYDPADPLIPPIANRWAMTFLRTHTELEEHSYPGMGHSVSMPEIADLTKFLRRTLPAAG
jgi:phospholipase/carboxylesterase